jgi:hypothetical protein
MQLEEASYKPVESPHKLLSEAPPPPSPHLYSSDSKVHVHVVDGIGTSGTAPTPHSSSVNVTLPGDSGAEELPSLKALLREVKVLQ